MNRPKVKKLAVAVMASVMCLSFAVTGLARHHHHYYYDNGFGGTFRTRTRFPDHFAAYLGLTGAGAIPVFDATKLAENIKILAEFEKITGAIQDLFGLRKEKLASTLDIEVKKLARVNLPETAKDKESQKPGVLLSGETIIDPKVQPKDTVLEMRVDHFDAFTIPTDIGYGMSLHSTMAMDDHMAMTRSTMKSMDEMTGQLLDIGDFEPKGIAGALQQGIAISKLSGGIEEARAYNRMADLSLETVEYGRQQVLQKVADKGLKSLMTFRVIDPYNMSDGEKKMLEENKELVRTKNLGWKTF